jgi:hypothetical protein
MDLILLSIILAAGFVSAAAKPNSPVLVSESNSTRAIALDAVIFTREPFAPTSFYNWGQDQQTRVMIFCLNVTLQPGEDLTAFTADAEDAAHKHHSLIVEYFGPVPSLEWLNAVILRLSDDLTEVGDVLVRLSYNGVASNRVRLGIGHVGGGPPDDVGAMPTPAPPYFISGRITEDGKALGSVSVTLSGAQIQQIVTDDQGLYSFTVGTVGDYTLTPSKQFYDFNPLSFAFINLTNYRTDVNFGGTRQRFSISGQVTDDANKGLSGILVNLAGNQTATVTTDDRGYYSFAGLPAGLSYSITLTPSTFYEFGSRSISPLSNNLAADFHGTLRKYVIGGRVTNSAGQPLSGATMSLSGSQTGTTKTQSDGRYAFIATARGDYTIAPLTTRVIDFAPGQSQSVTTLAGDQNNFDFVGTRNQYQISGQVTNYTGATLGGTTVTLTDTSNNLSRTVATGSDGSFWFTGVPAGFNYVASPAETNIIGFTQQNVLELSDNLVWNFAATRKKYAFAGTINDDSGHPLGAVSMKLTGDSFQVSTVTDSDGRYSFNGLAAGAYFMVTPAYPDYVFSPPTTQVYMYSFLPDVDFTGIKSYTVSGRVVRNSGEGIGGATITLAGPQTSRTVTALDGTYSLFVTAIGDYTITASIDQDYYTFTPPSQQLVNLNDNLTVNFSAQLAPFPDPAYVLEFDGTPKTVDYGYFWDPEVDLGHFYWEFWARPGSNAGATYMVSDGYGGLHALLFGVANFGSSEPGRYQLLGNIADGTSDISHLHYFGGDQGPAIGEWAHMAVGWDGQNIITYYDGVPVGRTSFTGPRLTPGPGGGGGRLLIGGSDHSNFDGRIAEVRAYEGSNPREDATGLDPHAAESTFIPQAIFSVEGNFLSYFFRPGQIVADLSNGYNGSIHRGVLRGTIYGIIYPCDGCPLPQYVTDSSAPNFATNAPPQPVSVPTPAAAPNGTRVFDSFGRAKSTYLFDATGGLGSTEGGSAGQQAWQTYPVLSGYKPFGILNGMVVLLDNATSVAWVPTGSLTGNLSISAERHARYWNCGVSTGLGFRVTDEKNYFFAYTRGDSTANQVLTVGYYQNGQRTDLTTSVNMPVSWTTLSVVTNNSGSIRVYADGVVVYSGNSGLMVNATGAGLYNDAPGMALVNRWDNFTVYDTR